MSTCPFYGTPKKPGSAIFEKRIHDTAACLPYRDIIFIDFDSAKL